MTTRHRVALLGFSAFERSALESYFRLAGEGGVPQYELLPDIVPEAGACEFVLADSNHAEVLAVVSAAGRVADTVYVGTHLAPAAPFGALAGMRRPIDALHVLREFDAAVARRSRVAPAQAEPPVEAEPRRQHKFTARARQRAKAQAARETSGGDYGNSVLLGGDSMFDHVLVVDDSEIARRFLQVRLQRLGYTVHTASNGLAAVDLAATRQFAFIFLDVAMDGLDGFEACKQIKQMPWPLDGRLQRGPAVIMVTGRTGAVDRIRGTLAGCDAYLTKPLNEEELIGTLAKYDDSFERVFEDTVPPVASL